MKVIARILLIFIVALGANWLHNFLYDWAWQHIGASYPLGDLWQVLGLYSFLYLLVFAGVALFNTSTTEKILYGSIVVLLGSLLPLFATNMRYYFGSNISFQELMMPERWSYVNLLFTHGATLILVNILFFLLKRYYGILRAC